MTILSAILLTNIFLGAAYLAYCHGCVEGREEAFEEHNEIVKALTDVVHCQAAEIAKLKGKDQHLEVEELKAHVWGSDN